MHLILQHWSGEPVPELVQRSSENIARYAEKLGAEYRLLRGDAFRPKLSAPCQKMAMLSEDWDTFETVVMLDADMFARTDESIFEVEGVGVCSDHNAETFARLEIRHPKHVSRDYPFWGGAAWKLTKADRVRLRRHLPKCEVERFSGRGNFEDEAIMHRLVILADYKDAADIPMRWACSSYDPDVDQAAIVHIRQRSVPYGSGVPRQKAKTGKLHNYRRLVERGILLCPT